VTPFLVRREWSDLRCGETRGHEGPCTWALVRLVPRDELEELTARADSYRAATERVREELATATSHPALVALRAERDGWKEAAERWEAEARKRGAR
jgi:hypothetical protein